MSLSLLSLVLGTALAAPPRVNASDEWVRVPDDALLCTHPGRQGQCVRFRQPGSRPVEGKGPRVFRLVAARAAEVELQAQFGPEYETCGVLPTRITPLTLRLFAPSGAPTAISPDEACVDDEAGDRPGPGRDPMARASATASVADGAWALWPDGSLAGQLRQELWLQEEHGLYADGDRWCASFDIGPDDGGAVSDRALDICFRSRDVRVY